MAQYDSVDGERHPRAVEALVACYQGATAGGAVAAEARSDRQKHTLKARCRSPSSAISPSSELPHISHHQVSQRSQAQKRPLTTFADLLMHHGYDCNARSHTHTPFEIDSVYRPTRND